MGKKEKDLQEIESEAYKTFRRFMEKRTQMHLQFMQKLITKHDASDFYSFLKTSETYQDILNSDISLFLTTDSPVFQLLKNLDLEKIKPICKFIII